MVNVKVFLLIASIAVGIVLMGCEEPRPVSLALLVDPTVSARSNRERGLEYLKTVLRGNYLPRGSRVAIIRCDCEPYIVWSGEKRETAEIIAAYEEALRGKDCGTDPAGAMDLAREWLLQSAQRNAARRIMSGWVDCVADPHKEGKRITVFRDPHTLTWNGAATARIEVSLFGVAQDQQQSLLKAWTPRLAAEPRLFEPGHRIRPEDLGLVAGSAF